ncbi:hypothetical protein Bbelb_199530 [Branchiostoma belcheri]|nr:hypothetical protein Bbelb_199530 [Branchiostoma belcheri]
MYEQAEPVRSPFSGPDSRQTSGSPQPRPVRQSGSRGRVRHGNGDSEKHDQDTSSHTYKDAEEVKRYATSADRSYPGGASGRRGVCSFLRGHRSCLAAGIAVLLSLCAVGLAPLTFSNKQEISQLSTTVDALKRDQDDLRQLSTTVDALNRDQDALRRLSTTVDALKRDQDALRRLSTTVDALKRDQDALRRLSTTVDALKNELDNNRRIPTNTSKTGFQEKALPSCPGGYTMWRGTCFKAFMTKKTFDQAAAACRADGGTLAMPRDAETNAFLISLYKSVGEDWNFWFGLHDRRREGRFEWVDGSALGPNSSWGPGQPDNRRGGEDCVLFSATYMEVSEWHVYPCHEQFYFICQTAQGRP